MTITSFSIPNDYGYIFLVVGLSFVLNIFLGMNVAMARKKYDVQYPNCYAPSDHKYAKEFNNCQRAHQNMLESYGFVLVAMCLCGFVYPITSAIYGAIWIIGRAIYAYGYTQHGPNGRMVGGLISHIGDMPLVFLCFRIAYESIKFN